MLRWLAEPIALQMCLTVALALAVVITTAVEGATLGKPAAAGSMLVYVGARAKGQAGGIHRYELDMATGRLTRLGVMANVANPSFIAIHPSGRFLYAVNEMSRRGKKRTGAVSAFAIGRPSAALDVTARAGEVRFLNQQPSGGPGPCHLVVDRAGKNVLAANYGGGSVCVLPIGPDGRLGPRTAFVQHEGSSVHPKRQTAPHAHSITVDPGNRFAFAADLGLDKVLVYRFDAEAGTLEPHKTPFARVAPGAGPRHFAFHPGGRTAYLINELDSTVTAFRYDAGPGVLTEMQTVTTLPKDFQGANATAEVVVHPSGKYLYGSNRGHNSIAVFTIDRRSGKLAPVGHESVQGDWPRNFNIDPTGRYLLVANRRSNNIVVFRIEANTGGLKPTRHAVDAPGPMCVKFLALPRINKSTNQRR